MFNRIASILCFNIVLSHACLPLCYEDSAPRVPDSSTMTRECIRPTLASVPVARDIRMDCRYSCKDQYGPGKSIIASCSNGVWNRTDINLSCGKI